MSNSQRPLRDVRKSIHIPEQIEQHIVNTSIRDGLSHNTVINHALKMFFGDSATSSKLFRIMFSHHSESIAVYPAYIEAPDKSKAEELFLSSHPGAVIHQLY